MEYGERVISGAAWLLISIDRDVLRSQLFGEREVETMNFQNHPDVIKAMPVGASRRDYDRLIVRVA